MLHLNGFPSCAALICCDRCILDANLYPQILHEYLTPSCTDRFCSLDAQGILFHKHKVYMDNFSVAIAT